MQGAQPEEQEAEEEDGLEGGVSDAPQQAGRGQGQGEEGVVVEEQQEEQEGAPALLHGPVVYWVPGYNRRVRATGSPTIIVQHFLLSQTSAEQTSADFLDI